MRERESESKSERVREKEKRRVRGVRLIPFEFSMSQFNLRTLLRHQVLAGKKKEIEKENDLIFKLSRESDAMKVNHYNTALLKYKK